MLVGDGEDDAPVLVLKDVSEAMIEQPRHGDVAALDQPHLVGRLHRCRARHEFAHPGTCGVDDHARLHVPLALAPAQQRTPATTLGSELLAAHAREDRSPARLGIQRVEHHQPRVIDLAVGVHEAAPVAVLERLPGNVRLQIDRRRCGQVCSRGQVVVQEEPGADHPGRPQVRIVWHDEVQRPHDVRGGAEQHLALAQRLAHEGEVELLQVAQATVDELGAGGGGVRGQVVLLAQDHLQPAPGRITGDP